MNSNRFSMAVHVLALLARHGGTMTSEEVARSVNTNPVVIRRLLGRLREAGLVEGVSGPGGGSELSVSPEKISLFDIYQAVEERELICVHEDPSPKCPVGRRIQAVFENITSGITRAVTKELKATKLSAIVRSFGG